MNKFSLKNFIYSRLGFKHISEDTYRDQAGKGILQRFMDICSEYYEEEILPPVDDIMDLIDLDKTPEIMLPLLWEYFGHMPYAYGLLTTGKPYTKDDLSSWVNNNWMFPQVDTRNLLKFAISLYKIRCTEEFYEILGRFYNIKITIYERPSDNEQEVMAYDGRNTFYDVAYYDAERDCLQCLELQATVIIPKNTWDAVTDNSIDIDTPIHNILNKYLPVHIKPFTGSNTYITGSSYPPIIDV